MKKAITLFMCLGFFSAIAQIEPLLVHNWRLESVVTADSILDIPDDINTYAIFFESSELSVYDFEVNFGFCQIIEASMTFDNENQSFNLDNAGIPLGHCGIQDILSYEYFLYEEFIFDDMNDQIFESIFTYTFTINENIIYLYLTNSEGSIATYTASTLSNEDFNSTQFSIYPNPTTNLLHIEGKGEIIQNVEIFNLSGKRVLQINANDIKTIAVGHLDNGLYLLKIQTESGSVVKKFLKE
jgi:hypothetical protein